MIKSITTLFILFLTFLNLPAQENNMQEIINIIEEIKSGFAPDKRTALFDVSISGGNDLIVLSGETNLIEAENELIARLKEKSIMFENNIRLLPSEELGDKVYGIINLSVANIRSKHSHSAELTTQALLGTPVKVLKKDDGFCLVQTPDKYISWVDNSGIKLVNKEELEKWINADKIIYNSEYGFSFAEADINSERVSDLVAGDILINLGKGNNFYNVEYPDGRTAFIEADKCLGLNDWFSEAYPTEENIISTAKKFMGIPYLWGGTSTKGMDCSGFTKTVYFLNGVVLQRDASQQVNTGILVDTEKGLDNLKPGDLLFFGFKQTEERKERITHVGIYIGNNEFIHASGKVMINSLNPDAANFSEYRLKQFIRAKRIINSVDDNGITSIKNNKFYSGEF